ncbi:MULTISPECIES: helix-turn-helix domain-containing protein [Hydrogenovibrio]|uniref:XRE family transcriptional regulator n=2 Tax=Hydrogenovibrio TaxID=28884 RepID=A0A4P7P235_9GAMM|nr:MULTISPECIES: helix-turn-helix transcriptional regulator [Hydrogenovibrio]QAB16261.1 XRE family transcriptional regulator [Hydrogenovibrio thermophilus]QBZ84187.1 XRE family transcriptional regulator [Hydrogenovibrio crunogenus]RUM92453.1 MAG: transcriptional regulator [Thiomicrospira sp.]
MIRFKLKELIAKKEFLDGRRVTLKQIAEATGINRMTLTKINTQHGYSTSTETLNKLCKYFDCEIADLVEYISDEKFQEMTSKD